ncbi:MAG TPA: enoyl-CoA hydratase-related protein, partial [Tepidiformaceae bacterium]|nr:enoyl-CoA hydratase-related protein [Tepidiformaceae bacterium]
AGLGFSIACLLDLRFVEKQAKLVTAFSQRGLVAEHGVSWILFRLIGPSRALDILWTSRRLTADEALELGIANRVCETGEALADAKAYISELAASASPASLMRMKQQVYRHLNMDLGEAMRESDRLMDESLKQADFGEGVRSFMEKRPPQFGRIGEQ